MVDLTPEQLQKQARQYAELNRKIEETNKTIKDATRVYGENSEAVRNLSAQKDILIQKQKAVIESATETERTMIRSYTVFGTFSGSLGQLGSVVRRVADAFGSNLNETIKQGTQLFAIAKMATVRDLINPLTNAAAVTKLIPESFRNIDKAISNLRKAQTTARVGFLLLGRSVKQAAQAAVTYPQALRLASAETGLTTAALDKLNQQMNIVPDAMGMTTRALSRAIGVTGALIQPTSVLATVMRRFGLSSQQAGQFGRQAFVSFNQTTETTIRQMALVAGAARQTGTDFRTTHDQILEASKGLGIFGLRTSAATNIWSTFTRSLRGTGVPLQAVGKIVGDVTRAIAGMSVQNRAFIAMVSGLTRGATALGGAFKMELALRQTGGRGLEQNLLGLTRTLGRFSGGRIITLEQAAKNPQLEMQFQLQRQMLGKFTSISNQEQQNRILETLGGVQRGGITQVQGARELRKVFAEGRTIQEKSLTALQRVEQNTRALIGGKLDQVLTSIDNQLRGQLGGGGQTAGPGGLRILSDKIARAGRRNPLEARGVPQAIGRVVADISKIMRAFPRTTGVGRVGPRSTPTSADRLSSILNQLKIGLTGGRLRVPTTARTATRPPSTPRLGAVPTVQRLPLTPLLRAVTSANSRRDGLLRSATRHLQAIKQSIDNLKSTPTGVAPTAPAATAGATTSRIIVELKSIGGTQKEQTDKIYNDLRNWLQGYR